jgi:hypothetical protein
VIEDHVRHALAGRERGDEQARNAEPEQTIAVVDPRN